GFVDGVAERARTAGYGTDFRAEQPHAEHVGLLAANVFLAHVDDAFEAKTSAGGRGGNAVLAGAGLGDHAAFAHAEREERLAEGVVDFVRAGVIEVFALEVNLGSADFFAQTLGVVERRRTA